MKVLLVTGILLICLHGVASTALDRIKRQSVSVDKNNELEKANEFRRAMAKSGISNMHKIKWNDALTVPPCDQKAQEGFEQITVWVKQEVKKIGIQENVPPTEEQKQDLLKLLNAALTAIVQVSVEMPNNCMHPLQTEMKCSAEQVCSVAGHKFPNCICGPMTQPLKETDFIKGSPGSACRGKVEDGLCVNGASVATGTLVLLAIFYMFA